VQTNYAELHAHSAFSLLDGASEPETLVARAAALGLPALALTDHDAVYGVPRFLRAAHEHGIRPVLGAELTLAARGEDCANPHHLTLLVENQAGWHNLCYLISRGRAAAAKGNACLPPVELVGCTGGLIALSGCRRGAISRALLAGDRERALAHARRYRDLFGPDHFYIELHNHLLPDGKLLRRHLAALAAYLRLETVATNNIHYATRDRHRLQDVLVAIRHGLALDQVLACGRANSEYYLKGAAEMAALFPDYPQALANSTRLAERCAFAPAYGLQDLPHFPTPGGMSSNAYLRRRCAQGLQARYGNTGSYRAQARAQLERELVVIEGAGLANYFLVVGDLVRFAAGEGIRCQGRGSAAGSLVAYLLGISPIDPLAHDLVFERFLSEERLQADARFLPDIDIDFDAARREEVIQYMYDTYGEAHTAMACTFVTYRRRSALRDVGKVLELPPAVVATARRALETGEEAGIAENESLVLLLELAEQLEGLPRHLGIHAGGMVVTGAPLMGRVPTEPATMPGRVVVQWDKEGLEDAGLVKIDLLGLRMLAAVTETLALIEQTEGKAPDLSALTFDDPAVYAMLTAGETLGVFQVESRAQTQLLPRLKPRCFDDLVVAISLIRPGPLQGNMVHPYLRRREGLEPVTYTHPLLRPALAETLGVILFQEQVLEVARDLAGFTPGQGELLRRALGAKRPGEAVEKLREQFLSGATAQGVPAETAETVFEQLCAFGGYAFARSHAAAFSVLVYQSAWLRRYHFLPFFTALLNNQPMGFWPPAVLVGEVKRQGYQVLPVDVHASEGPCTLEENALRLGLNRVKGVGEALIARITTARAEKAFASLADFWERAHPGRRVGEALITAGALDGWGIPRRQLLWELGMLSERPGELDLDFRPEAVTLPALSPLEALRDEEATLGFSAGEHLLAHYRPALRQQGIRSCEAVIAAGEGARVQVAGRVVVHQSPPTAKGVHFLTLEDETGLLDVIVRPAVYRQHRRLLHTTGMLLVRGRVQRRAGPGVLVAHTLLPLWDEQPVRR